MPEQAEVIAEVTDFLNVDIESLETTDLAQLVIRADLPHVGEDALKKVPYYDRETLRRLAYQAREVSRNKANALQ